MGEAPLSGAGRVKNAALVPVYNEGPVLGPFLDALKIQGLEILVVDDGSTDGSGAVAAGKGIPTIVLERNSGKGEALRRGFEELVRQGAGWIAILDGDGQHRPDEIPRFFEKARSGDFGIVNGNRLDRPERMPFVRFWTNTLMSMVLSAIAGQRILDSQCGFKLVAADFLKKADLRCRRFEIESELLLEAARLKFRIGSVPVTSVYGTEHSHVRPLRDTVRFFRFLWGWATRKH